VQRGLPRVLGDGEERVLDAELLQDIVTGLPMIWPAGRSLVDGVAEAHQAVALGAGFRGGDERVPSSPSSWIDCSMCITAVLAPPCSGPEGADAAEIE